MVKSSPSKINKVEKSSSPISSGPSSMSSGPSSQEHSSSQDSIDIRFDDMEDVIIKKESDDEFDVASAPEYDMFVSSTFIVLSITPVTSMGFGNDVPQEKQNVCNVYTVDPLGIKRAFIFWKELAQKFHDYFT
jgi:hypothetical protein